MSDLRKAAQAVLTRWDGKWDWLDDGPTADLMKDLRAALAESEQDGICKHCTDGCPACDARKQIIPKPVCDECGKSKTKGWALYCVDCMEPVFSQRGSKDEQ